MCSGYYCLIRLTVGLRTFVYTISSIGILAVRIDVEIRVEISINCPMIMLLLLHATFCFFVLVVVLDGHGLRAGRHCSVEDRCAHFP